MIPKLLDQISMDDIEALVADQVHEGRTIDYKAALPGDQSDEKVKFLASVSAFANASGGDLVYGVTESEGVPTSIDGLAISDVEAAILRLENMIRDGIEPRITDIRIQPVTGFTRGPVLIIRIPQSWAAPHMVTFGMRSPFYARGSTGKHPMDVTELRAAFALSGSLPERMRRFRDERLSLIIAGDTPVRLSPGSKITVHLIPLSAFTTNQSLSVALIRAKEIDMPPLGASGWCSRINLDGIVTSSGDDRQLSKAYCQLFRSGIVEAVSARLLGDGDTQRFIASVAYEREVIGSVAKYLATLETLAVPFPIVIMVSLTSAKGVSMYVGSGFDGGSPIDRDTVCLPDVMVEARPDDVSRLLQPVFDAIWNACGLERSFNYDAGGNWRGR